MPDIQSINDVFKNDKVLTNIRAFVKQADVVLKFSEVFPELKKIVKAIKLENGNLYLKVENSIWRSELKFKQKFIVERVNNYFNEELIKSIKFLA
jgi:hypothetical protein